YRVSLHIRDAQAPNLPMLTLPSLLVMELPPGPPCDVLIGMDVLMGCKLIVDGPGKQFTFEFLTAGEPTSGGGIGVSRYGGLRRRTRKELPRPGVEPGTSR